MNLDGWEIDIEALPGPKQEDFPNLNFTQAIYPSPNHRLAVVLYGIYEIRMCWEVGLSAVFENRKSPKSLPWPNDFTVEYESNGVVWFSDSLVALKTHCYLQIINQIYIPFTIVDFEQKRFSAIPLENSYPYQLEYSGTSLILNEMTHDERFESFDGSTYGLAEMKWQDLSELEHFDDWFSESFLAD